MLSTVENLWLRPHPKLDGISLMDHLFNRMDGLYPNRWQANFKTDSAIQNWKESWAEAFEEEGLMPQDVAQGIKNCRRMFDWPPSLTEFLRACRPYLEVTAAYHIAVEGLHARARGEMGRWPHPAIFWAAVKVGEFDLLGSPHKSVASRWEKALDDELEKTEWDPIPQPVRRIEDSGKGEVSKELRAETERLVKQLSPQPRKNYRQWAWNILNSPDGKAPIAIKKARECLEEYEQQALVQWAQQAVDSTEHCKRAKQIAQEVLGKEAA